MPSRVLLECSFLIPIRRDRHLSDGKSHETEAWAWLKRELRVFGGTTMARQLYEGWYIDPQTKKPVSDMSRKYYVAVTRDDLAELRSVLSEACLVFCQKCIYLTVAGKVEFIGRGRHG